MKFIIQPHFMYSHMLIEFKVAYYYFWGVLDTVVRKPNIAQESWSNQAALHNRTLRVAFIVRCILSTNPLA